MRIMEKSYKILVINPGSTSTKISVFQNEKEIIHRSISHSVEELGSFQKIIDQYEFRSGIIQEVLSQNGYTIEEFDVVVGRGGLLRPIPGGTYTINQKMLNDLKKAGRGEHASNLGALIAHALGEKALAPSYIVDPVVVDELEPVARISGLPELERRSIFHALNQRTVARKAAQKLGKSYEESNFIVAHLGGGISVGCHSKGRVIDVNNAFNGDGPFSPERSGGLPAGQLAELCFSGKLSLSEMKNKLVGKGGLAAYLGTNDSLEVNKRIKQGDNKAELIYRAMAYQISREIGACASVLKGKIDAIVISGGLARDEGLIQQISGRVQWIAQIVVFPGEKEMEALALGAHRVLQKKEMAKEY